MSEPTAVAILSTDKHLDLDSRKIVKSITEQEIKLAKELKIDTAIDLGDSFNSRKSQPLQILKSFGVIHKKYEKAGLKRIMIPGNHDKVDYESKDSYLDEFRYHPNLELTREFYWNIYAKDLKVWYLSYFDEATTYSYYLSQIVETVKAEKEFKHILLTHVGIEGVINNGGDKVINSISKDLFGVFYKVLIGHYHNKSFHEPNIYYIGSTYPRSYGEDNDKGFTVLYGDGSIKHHKAKFKEYYTYDFHLPNDNQKLEEAFEKYKHPKNFIRFKIYGNLELIRGININRFKEVGIVIKPMISQIEAAKMSASSNEFSVFTKKTILDEYEIFSTKNKLSKEDKKYFKDKLTKKLQ